jgi:hypothetical protein
VQDDSAQRLAKDLLVKRQKSRLLCRNVFLNIKTFLATGHKKIGVEWIWSVECSLLTPSLGGTQMNNFYFNAGVCI